MLETPDFKLTIWAERHVTPFCQMHEDTEVMADLGGPLAPQKSREKFARYANAWHKHSISRWALEDMDGGFLGYCGVMFRPDVDHPLGAHYEIGWRLCRHVWGKGFAVKAANLALEHAWATINPSEILSYTAPDNKRSQKVMERLGLTRYPERDFFATYEGFPNPWNGLVWAARSQKRLVS
jgi:RimJ/RimL family protein N-acetyltransferase